MQTCNKCQTEKPLTEFFKDKGFKSGYASICKVCKTASTMEWRAKNKDKYNSDQRSYMKAMCPQKRYGIEIKRRYGCTLEEYNDMLIKQDGACAICRKLHNPAEKKGRLYVDHCHYTGNVRALLCSSCNSMLGYAKDDSRILLEAAAYLARHKAA